MVTILLILTILITCSCSSGSNAPQPQKFKRPDVPSMISNQDEAISYIAKHYWDNFLKEDREYPSDTAVLFAGLKKDDFEKAFSEYATFIMALPVDEAMAAQQKLASQVEKMQLKDKVTPFWESFSSMEDKYFNHPNSPYRSEEMYLYWMEATLHSSVASSDEKIVAEGLIPLLSLNRLGTAAANFPFTLGNGKTMHLYDVTSDFIILLLSNPGCPNCKEITDELERTVMIQQMLQNGTLSIVNIYPDDDYQAWKDFLPEYSDKWVNGWDQTNEFESLYYLRAIPSLYLLGKNYTVLEKDAPIERIFRRLDGNTLIFQ